MSEEEFLEVVAAKGGALEALEYGLHWTETPVGSDLRTQWKALGELWIDFKRTLDQFEDDYEIEPM